MLNFFVIDWVWLIMQVESSCVGVIFTLYLVRIEIHLPAVGCCPLCTHNALWEEGDFSSTRGRHELGRVLWVLWKRLPTSSLLPVCTLFVGWAAHCYTKDILIQFKWEMEKMSKKSYQLVSYSNCSFIYVIVFFIYFYKNPIKKANTQECKLL